MDKEICVNCIYFNPNYHSGIKEDGICMESDDNYPSKHENDTCNKFRGRTKLQDSKE
jgi:hypothetical protein